MYILKVRSVSVSSLAKPNVFKKKNKSRLRLEHAAEWPPQAAHEGSVCGAVSDRACETELFASLPAHAHGPTGIGTQRLPDPGKPGFAHSRALRGQPAARLPVRPHPACPSRAHAGTVDHL